MNRKKFLKEYVSDRFFEYPPSKFKAWRYAQKFNYLNTKVVSATPNIYICNKCTEYDKFLVAHSFDFNYVFLKDEYVTKISQGTMLKEETESLFDEIEMLEAISASIVIFPEQHLSVFGNCETLNTNITDFIAKIKMNVKFFNLIGTYFAYPVWSPQMRDSKTKSSIQFSIKKEQLQNTSQEKINSLINGYMPSSASTYSRRYNPEIESPRRAENLETIFYVCPHCVEFFSIYSEFSCIKCKNCGKAIEFNSNGTLSLAKNIESIDDYKEFQFKALNKYNFTIKPLVIYDDIKICKPNFQYNKFTTLTDVTLEIYGNKLHLFNETYNKTYKLSDIRDIELKRDNVVILKIKKDEVILKGEHKENLYIIFDLIKITK